MVLWSESRKLIPCSCTCIDGVSVLQEPTWKQGESFDDALPGRHYGTGISHHQTAPQSRLHLDDVVCRHHVFLCTTMCATKVRLIFTIN